MPVWSKEVFAANLNRYMIRNDISQKELAEIVGVSPPTVHDWLKARKFPRIDKIEILANYFGCLKSDLIEEKTEEHREMQKNNDIMTDIVLRMKSDQKFFSVVLAISKLNDDKLSSIDALLK